MSHTNLDRSASSFAATSISRPPRMLWYRWFLANLENVNTSVAFESDDLKLQMTYHPIVPRPWSRSAKVLPFGRAPSIASTVIRCLSASSSAVCELML